MRVLITGGSGFLGRHLARKMLDRGDTVCIYSRDEVKQANMMADFQEHPNLRMFIGDIRDAGRVQRATRGCDVVIAAAALKRIETGFYNPSEMVATNIYGTQNCIDAAAAEKVQRFIFISSDKAWQPISPYGQSKALAESLVLNANHVFGKKGPTFKAVRYGNVANSTGSVIPKWRKLLETGKTVPVTDPDATRFWMHVSEAVDLVLQACDEKSEGLLIPALPAYRVHDLAVAMGARSIEVVGLPSWEKKHESMAEWNSSDTARRMTIAELEKELENIDG